tara:strand:+ start:1096 stop:1743 length:648 start_codon:yes stop_codon:yes gene_type:complete
MDTVRYSRGWINKNKIKDKQNEILLSVPIFKEDREKNINEIKIKNSDTKQNWHINHLNSIFYAYKNSKNFDEIFPEIDKIFKLGHNLLNELCWDLIDFFLKYLQIDTKIIKMSEKKFAGKKSDLILNHALDTDSKIVFLGENGKDYIIEENFLNKKILPVYQNYKCNIYDQVSQKFTEKCSILDLLMNEGKNAKKILTKNNIDKEELIKIYKSKF